MVKCTYRKPYAKPSPIICEEEATEELDYGFGKAPLCEKHFIHFWEKVYPFLENVGK